ncbi:MAG: 30S ribosome-binding factor RbfA [Deltaproteobacteria bacterium]|nr:30S ribosome-binding factor RbfA [Deltaproteobacteria bacterium]
MNKEKERRLLRVGQTIHNELSLMLLKDTKDPVLMDVTVTGVKMAQDLRGAKVFYSVLDTAQKERVQRSLGRAAPFFQGKIGQLLQLRHTPRLYFVFDETPEKSARINEIVNETKRDRQREQMQMSTEQVLAKRISEAEHILLCCHRKPDGDALGSVLAMMQILKLTGKRQITAWVPDEIPPTLSFLPGVDDLVTELEMTDAPDMTIILDTASPGQLHDEMAQRLREQRLGHVAVIDHHDRYEDFGHTVVRRDASATGQVLFDLIGELIWPMDDTIALCLYAAIVADTGNFRFGNTSKVTFETAARLMAFDVKPADVSKRIFDTFTLSRQRLLGKVTDTLELFHDGRYARLYCTRQMLDETGASAQDLEGFVNIGRNVIGVEVAVLYTETDDAAKASLRANNGLDVAAIAATLGGGGHKAAAGLTQKGVSLEDAMNRLDAEIAKLFS